MRHDNGITLLLADGRTARPGECPAGTELLGPDGKVRHLTGTKTRCRHMYTVFPLPGRPVNAFDDTLLPVCGKDLSSERIVKVGDLLGCNTESEGPYLRYAGRIRSFEKESRYNGDAYDIAGNIFLSQTEWNRDPVYADAEIVDMVLFSDERTRLEFLAGVMDRTGHVNADGNMWSARFEFYTTAKKIADLASSLGIRTTIRKQNPYHNTGKHNQVLVNCSGYLGDIPVRKAHVSDRAKEWEPGLDALAAKFRIKDTGTIAITTDISCDGDGLYLSGDWLVHAGYDACGSVPTHGRKTIRERIKGLLKSRNGHGGTHGN